MADNTLRKNGFRLANGRPVSQEQIVWIRADASRSTTNNGGDIFLGDAVTVTSSGLATPAVSTGTTTGGPVAGVVVSICRTSATPGINDVPFTGINPSNLDSDGRYLPANVNGWVGIVPAAGNLFETTDYSTTALTVAAISDAFDLISGVVTTTLAGTTVAHGVASTGISTMGINSSVAVTNSDLILVDIVKDPLNDGAGDYPRVIVRFNNPAFIK